MNFNQIRKTYVIISFCFVAAAWYLHDLVLKNIELNTTFSYIGVIATIIGLYIAIAEIIHNASISKTIEQQSNELLTKVKTIETASNISDCLSLIDALNLSLARDDYKGALAEFQCFRKISVKVLPNLSDKAENLNLLGELEQGLLRIYNATKSAPINKAQKTQLLKKVLLLKQQIEYQNPARGKQHATDQNH